MSRRRRSDGRFDLPSGTIHPALHRLERTGLIASDWSVHAGRRRRTYQLTRAGPDVSLDERTVERYLEVVAQKLPGPAALRRDVLDEVRDGLLAAAEDAEVADRPGRERAVIETFGDPISIGAALADELRLRLARRRALQMLAVLVVLGVGCQVYGSTVASPRR